MIALIYSFILIAFTGYTNLNEVSKPYTCGCVKCPGDTDEGPLCLTIYKCTKEEYLQKCPNANVSLETNTLPTTPAPISTEVVKAEESKTHTCGCVKCPGDT